jgi:hypothetical protein
MQSRVDTTQPVVLRKDPMSNDRTGRILALTGIALELRAVMEAAGLEPSFSDLAGFARLVWLAEQRQHELQFVASERGEQPTVN